ncbi:MAG: hypothetical protein HZB16_21820, partial [Armatimonadetes bacterium]|nr:hypothetical protein [Armatimonadota bacterium]
MRPLLLLSLATIAHAAVELKLDPPSTACFSPQTAVVHVTNTADAPVPVALTLTVSMPFGGVQTRTASITAPAKGAAEARLTYELYEAGKHTFAVTTKAGGAEVKTETTLDVAGPGDAAVPYPNYYRNPAHTGGLVSVGPDNRLVRAGKPWFPIGIYTTPTSERGAKELAEAGFDLVTLGVMPPKPLRGLLDLLQGWGLNAWVPVSHLLQFADEPERRRAELTELVAGVGDHPALALWESIDEPAWGGQPAWGLREGYGFLRGLDPQRPIWTNHAPRNTVRTLAFYNQATDIAGCDVYPVPMPQGQSDLPNKTLSVVGDETTKNIAAVRDEKPVFMVLQGFAWRCLDNRADPLAVYATQAETRYMAYDAVVSGAKGILYWGTPYTPKPSRFWSDLKAVVSELRALEPYLTAPAGPKTTLSPADSPVRALAKRIGGQTTVLLANRSGAEATVTVSVEGATGGWRCLFGDASPRMAGQGCQLTLPAWGARALTTDPAWNPTRHNYDAEAAGAKPPVALVAEPGNAIPNGGFEVDADGVPAGWDVRLPFTVTRDTEVKRSGQASLRIDSPSAGANPLTVFNGIVVKPDRRYRLTGWMRSDTPGVQGRFYAEWANASGWHSYVLPWVQPKGEWQQF